MKNKKFYLVISIIIVIILFVISYNFLNINLGKKDNSNYVYRLKWLANAGFIGDLYADNYGYFESNKLNVDVLPGGPELDPIRQLETGRAHFGVASSDQVIMALHDGADIVVIAQIYRTNPVQWIYRDDSLDVNNPSDLKNKKIGITYGDNVEWILKSFLNKYNLTYDSYINKNNESSADGDDVTLVGVKYSYEPFLKERVQLFPIYRNTQGVELKNDLETEGETAGFFNPSLYDVKFPANSIITTSKMMSTNKDDVKQFLNAALKGWNDSLQSENIQKSIKIISRYKEKSGSDVNKEIIEEQIKQTRKLVLPKNSSSVLGEIDVAAWKNAEKIMIDQDIIDSEVHIENYLRTDMIR